MANSTRSGVILYMRSLQLIRKSRLIACLLFVCPMGWLSLAAEESKSDPDPFTPPKWYATSPFPLGQVVGPGLRPAPPAPALPPRRPQPQVQPQPQPIVVDRSEPEPEPDFGDSDLPEWLDGFRMGGLIRFRGTVDQNLNFDRTDKTLLTSFTSICSIQRSTNRSCSQSGGTEYPDFGQSNHSSVPLYVPSEDTQESVQQKVQLSFHKEFGADVVANIVLQDSRVWGGQPGSINGVNTANSNTDEATDIREANLEIFDFLGFD